MPRELDATVTPEVAEYLDTLANEVPEHEAAKLPRDLSAGPAAMIKARDARIAELEAAIRRYVVACDRDILPCGCTEVAEAFGGLRKMLSD